MPPASGGSGGVLDQIDQVDPAILRQGVAEGARPVVRRLERGGELVLALVALRGAGRSKA